MNIQTPSIKTDRLLLLSTTQQHAEEIFKNFDVETTKYMVPIPPKTIQDTVSWIDSVLEKRKNQEDIQMTIFDQTTGEFIGNVGLHKIKTPTPELGIWIKKSAYGHKFGQEAIGALIDRANKNLEFEYLLYPVDKDNVPSRKVAEKFGGIVDVDSDGKEIVIPKKTFDPNKILNAVTYKIYPKK